MKMIVGLRGVWTRAPPSAQDTAWDHHFIAAAPPLSSSMEGALDVLETHGTLEEERREVTALSSSALQGRS